MRRVALVLPAVVPAHELNGLDPVAVHSSPIGMRSVKRMRSSSSGELICSCCQWCGSLAEAGNAVPCIQSITPLFVDIDARLPAALVRLDGDGRQRARLAGLDIGNVHSGKAHRHVFAGD